MRGYTSPGEAAAEGFAQGTRLGLDVRRAHREEQDYQRRQKEHAEDRGHLLSERDRQGRLNTRAEGEHAEDRDYTMGKRELEAIDAERTQLSSQLEQLAQQHGGFDKIPPDLQQKLLPRINDVNVRRSAVQERIYRPIRERYEKKAREVVEGLQSGRLNLGDMDDAEVYRAFMGVLRRDPRDALRGPNGEPSKIGGAIQRVTNGFESGDQQSIVEGANEILQPELQVGVDSDGPEGTTITGKTIERFVPSPDGKGFIPVIKVQVKGPDGRVGYYYAPPTEGRGTDPKSKISVLDPDKTMDRVGRMGVLEEMLNHPELRAKIERGAQAAGGEAQDFLSAIRFLPAKPGKFTTTNVNLGDRVIQQTRNEAGIKVSQEELKRGTSPDAQERTRGAGIRSAQGVRHDRVLVPTGENDDQGNPIMEERFVELPTRAGGPKPKVVDLPGGAKPAPRGAGATDKPGDVEKAANNEVARAAAGMNLSWDEASKRWKQADGKPATQDQVTRLNAVKAEALNRGKKAKGAADSVPAPKMSDTEVAELRAKAKKAIADGKDKAGVAKRFEELTGLKY